MIELDGEIPIQLNLVSTSLELRMVDNPYLDATLTAIAAVFFIIVSSYGVGLLARLIAKMMGATPKKQENTFSGYLFASRSLIPIRPNDFEWVMAAWLIP